MDTTFLLRDAYNADAITNLANRITRHYPEFPEQQFIKLACFQIHQLGFQEREIQITKALEISLPTAFKQSANILIDSLEPELIAEPGDTVWSGFMIIPQTIYIANNGLDDLQLSMRALKEMTKRFSAENAIRVFIEKMPEDTLKLLHSWTTDPNVHVRRLVSEGTRPRLPMAGQLKSFIKDPTQVFELLEKLKTDTELYVRRSVANSLNDISKDNPLLVLNCLKKWEAIQTKEMDWMIRHALRTLLRRGDSAALMMLGYSTPRVMIRGYKLENNTIRLGERLQFQFEILPEHNQKLMIDYKIYYMKANRKLKAKTFKGWKKQGLKDIPIQLHKQHYMKNRSTRKHYPGLHKVEIIINGVPYGSIEFQLLGESTLRT